MNSILDEIFETHLGNEVLHKTDCNCKKCREKRELEGFIPNFWDWIPQWGGSNQASNTNIFLADTKSYRYRGPINIINAKMPNPQGDAFSIKRNSVRNFGIKETIDAIKWIIVEWNKNHPEVKLNIRDISQKGGGEINPHSSHRLGLDVDIALVVRKSSKRIGKYRRSASTPIEKDYEKFKHFAKNFVELVASNPILGVKTIFFFDHTLHRLIRNSSSSRSHWRHFHIRFCRPHQLRSVLSTSKVYDKSERKGNYSC